MFVQVRGLGWDYLEGDQAVRHAEILEGRAGSPYQYRVLSEYAVHAVVLALEAMNVSHPVGVGFVAFRLLQNLLLFSLAGWYYARLGLGFRARILALSLLAWGMTHALYDSDLAFNTYSDIVFYLAGAHLVVTERFTWLLPLVAMSAFNRETSGLVPLMALAAPPPLSRAGGGPDKRWVIAGLGFLVYFAVLTGLRIHFGWRSFVEPHGVGFGAEMIAYNLRRPQTWVFGFATTGLIPVVAFLSWKSWPSVMHRLFLIVVPAWFCAHLVGSVLAESRVLLVPQALIFIPGAVLGVVQSQARVQGGGPPGRPSCAA